MTAVAAGRLGAAARPTRAVGTWLAVIAALVALMVLVGGYTRLTDSGLSITEWKPVTGAIPPLSHEAWQAEMEKYRQIPEYQLINKGMSLEAFQRIYLIEYTHRLLGRLIGVAFALPFIWFLIRGAIDRALLPRLIVLFLLGGLQGAVGWWMVASGLVERTDVSQYRLTAHLGLAVLILIGLIWTARGVIVPQTVPAAAVLRGPARLTLALIFLQILLGGLVAGLDAGMAYNTWPLMDGALVPQGLFAAAPAWLNLFENALTVQFNHRLMAIVVAAAALVTWWRARRLPPSPARRLAGWLLAGVALQFALGIWTLLAQVPLALGLAHQAGALAVITVATALAHASRRA
ncbi:COX15/CtaA family protein [Desertibaculum subflavum]|uniref:COX15/CtaA family protein n=1 Tax=Desertibaculum subflavum TaxID=2268458 RepID=UPI0034D17434